MSKKHEISLGRINLAEKQDGGMFKKTLLCRVGSFDGLFGPVDVNKDLLEALASNYNKIRARPQNDNDYAPILTDHVREVDRIKGRLMGDLSVDTWVDPETEEKSFGMYGSLRVDDPDAQKNVESGKYAQVSISFDDEKNEIFEVSFVAVEAARRSMVLSKGEKDMSKKALALVQSNKKALAIRMKEARAERKKSIAALSLKITGAKTEINSLSASMSKVQLSFKAAVIKGQFKDLAMQGKIEKKELDTLKFNDLAALPDAAFAVVLKSYEDRKPSKDIITFGQKGAPINAANVKLSNAQILKRMEAQKKGVALEMDGVEPKDALAADGVEPKDALAGAGMDKELSDKCMSDMKEISEKLSKWMSEYSKMEDECKSMSDSEDDEDKKESLAADDEEKKEKDAEKDDK